MPLYVLKNHFLFHAFCIAWLLFSGVPFCKESIKRIEEEVCALTSTDERNIKTSKVMRMLFNLCNKITVCLTIKNENSQC